MSYLSEGGIGIILTAVNIALLIILNKSTKIRKTFDNIVKNIELKANTKKVNPVSIYDYYGNKVIAEITINKLNNQIEKLNLEKLKKEYDIQLLVVKRGNDVISELEDEIDDIEDELDVVIEDLRN